MSDPSSEREGEGDQERSVRLLGHPQCEQMSPSSSTSSSAPLPVSSTPTTDPTFLRIGLSTCKAGMQKVDHEKVNRIIYDLSKNSNYFKNEQRKEQQTQARLKELLKQKENIEKRLTAKERTKKEEEVTSIICKLEKKANWTSRVWFHVDMDAFYASVEIRDNPSLQTKPVAVGGIGMISTANYIARTYGVRSAMPGFIGKQLCPELIFVRPNFEKYRAASNLTRQVFAEYDPNFISVSLDEASLDVTSVIVRRLSSSEKRQNPTEHKDKDTENELPLSIFPADFVAATAKEIALEIQQKVTAATRLTCSVGIAPNRYLAKICADVNKPNGLYSLLPPSQSQVCEFIRALPVRKINGIGKVTESLLLGLGIKKVSDFFELKLWLYLLFSKRSFSYFMEVALGYPSSAGVSSTYLASVKEEQKSISAERTFTPISSLDEQLQICRNLCRRLEADLAAHHVSARLVTIKLKLSDFSLRQRSSSQLSPIHSAADLYKIASSLLVSEGPLHLRLLGVRAGNLQVLESDRKQKTLMEIFPLIHHQRPHQPENEDWADETDDQRTSLDFTEKENSLDGFGIDEHSLNDVSDLNHSESSNFHSTLDDLYFPSDQPDSSESIMCVDESTCLDHDIRGDDKMEDVYPLEGTYRMEEDLRVEEASKSVSSEMKETPLIEETQDVEMSEENCSLTLEKQEGEGENEEDSSAVSLDLSTIECTSNVSQTSEPVLQGDRGESRLQKWARTVDPNAAVLRVKSSESDKIEFQCPICMKTVLSLSNLEMNMHVDNCLGLSKPPIGRSEKSEVARGLKRKEPQVKGGASKRGRKVGIGNRAKTERKSIMTLERYFK